MPGPTVLIVDDEKNILTSLSQALRIEDYEVDVAGNAEIAFAKLDNQAFDVVLLDVQLPDVDGLTVLRRMQEQNHPAQVIMMSGHATLETAVEATRLGAQTFLQKPLSSEQLLISIAQCLKIERLEHENRELRARSGRAEDLLGDSRPMALLREQIALAASANAPVLVTGERGTGKELVARAIHDGSKRAKHSLQKLNCAAVPAELIESELFGHETGAFTGATKQRRGKFERAHRGTLFLDEVGDMPSAMQAKLLRVLQEGELERVGGNQLIQVDVRVVAATNKSLGAEIDAGRFRADLYDRLNVVPLRLPPLRERAEDIERLAEHFLEQACKANDRRKKALSKGAHTLLRGYNYPGNVRELRNLMERLVILTPEEEITEVHARAALPVGDARGAGAGHYRPGVPLREMMDDSERELILRSLDHHQHHITNTAADLGLERSHLYKKMKALGIRRGD